jgi:hypothetical protein
VELCRVIFWKNAGIPRILQKMEFTIIFGQLLVSALDKEGAL